MTDVKIGILGAAGRMGKMLIRSAIETDGSALAAAVVRRGHEAVGSDAGTLAGLAPVGIAVSDNISAAFQQCDAVIDFTTPAASVTHATLAAETGTAFVLGTTGLDAGQLEAVEKSAARAPVIVAPNTSLGVNVLLALTRRLSSVLGEDWDIEVLEMHHRHKVDAPSGTALALGRAAAEGRGKNLDDIAQRTRDGITGPRRQGDIGFATLRGGSVYGEHTVMYAGDDERVELVHKVGSRAIFANGAVRAAIWASSRPAGLYSMADVLGLGDF